MKRLYHCNAKYDVDKLISYDTTIIEFTKDYCYLNVYRSMTTYQHIRKYRDRLYEIRQAMKAHIVDVLYNRMLFDRAAKCIIYDIKENKVMTCYE